MPQRRAPAATPSSLSCDARIGEHGVGPAFGHGTPRAAGKWSPRPRGYPDL
jgi:hypothetical protein